MAVSLLSHVVSDLCLGKPPLNPLFVTATLDEALAALKSSDEIFLSVWNCKHKSEDSGVHSYDDEGEKCECVGKISMVDLICYLCRDEKNLLSPSSALEASVTVLLPKIHTHIVHVEPSCSLLEAIDLIIRGAQNLIVPIQTKPVGRRRLNKSKSTLDGAWPTTAHKTGRRFCWLTQEDIIRFLLGSIGLFSPLPAISIADLGIISSTNSVLAVDYSSPASAAIPAILRASSNQTSVAVVDGAGNGLKVLIGEISPTTLARCDETAAAAAMATLSAGDLMAYIDGGGPPPESLVRAVKMSLEEKRLINLLSHYENSLSSSSSSSSSEEERPAAAKFGKKKRRSGRLVRSEAIVCNPKSSLMAVMIQAITYRVNYIWVMDKDCSLVGIVTCVDILQALMEHLEKLS